MRELTEVRVCVRVCDASLNTGCNESAATTGGRGLFLKKDTEKVTETTGKETKIEAEMAKKIHFFHVKHLQYFLPLWLRRCYDVF